MKCWRIKAIEELVHAAEQPGVVVEEQFVCRHCGKNNTIEHHGGRWCSNFGRFAAPPNPTLLPSNQPGYHAAMRGGESSSRFDQMGRGVASTLRCDWYHKPMEVGDGIYNDGEWMCWACVDQHAR